MKTDYSLVRLFEEDSDDLTYHIQSMDNHDRYLRFGYSISNSIIESYVDKTIKVTSSKIVDSLWFAIVDFNNHDEIVATIHISINGEDAEFGLTTLKEHRGKKLGQLLFARGYQTITERSIKRISMHCLSENKAMRHIARKFGMAVITHGSEVESSVTIQYPMSLKKVHEIKHSIIDKALLI